MLPKSQRLRSRRDFRAVYSRGRSYVSPVLVLYVRGRRQPAEPCRIGFSIGKKLGGAVQRNGIKRRLRAVLRSYAAKLRPGTDVVFVGRTRLKEADFGQMEAAVIGLLRTARMLVDEPPAAPMEG